MTSLSLLKHTRVWLEFHTSFWDSGDRGVPAVESSRCGEWGDIGTPIVIWGRSEWLVA